MPTLLIGVRFVLSVSSVAASVFGACPGLAVVGVAEVPCL